MTEAPASRARITAGIPAAPEPMTTMLAAWSQDAGDGTATVETVPGMAIGHDDSPSWREFAASDGGGPLGMIALV
jgi:hypothetical protein